MASYTIESKCLKFSYQNFYWHFHQLIEFSSMDHLRKFEKLIQNEINVRNEKQALTYNCLLFFLKKNIKKFNNIYILYFFNSILKI